MHSINDPTTLYIFIERRVFYNIATLLATIRNNTNNTNTANPAPIRPAPAPISDINIQNFEEFIRKQENGDKKLSFLNTLKRYVYIYIYMYIYDVYIIYIYIYCILCIYILYIICDYIILIFIYIMFYRVLSYDI